MYLYGDYCFKCGEIWDFEYPKPNYGIYHCMNCHYAIDEDGHILQEAQDES